MVFSSNVFLFLFLPIFLGLYYLSGQRYRNLLLLIASYMFYAWWRVDFLALFAGVTLWNYWIGLKVGAAGVRTKPAQRWLLLGVASTCASSATSSTPTSASTASTRS
jgi:alginate O-acetyltransferase complex protein AlgI